MKLKPFKNESYHNFSDPKILKIQTNALKQVNRKLGKTYDIIIGGKKYQTEQKLTSYNPSDKDEVVAQF